MGKELFEILTYFIIYSFMGWVMESIVRTIAEKKIINTGFLHGPICPIYGIGAIIMFTFLDVFKNNILLLFVISILVLTVWEYLVGVLLEKMFHTKYWDYSDHKFNFQGRVCLTNSICWGVLGVLFVKYIHPFMEGQIAKIDSNILYFVIGIISICVLVDAIVSITKLKTLKGTLDKIENLNKEIKEKLNDIKNLALEAEKTAEEVIAKENIQKLVEKLKKKRNRRTIHLYKNISRLKKAFPAINTKEITQILNEKIDIIKNKKNT